MRNSNRVVVICSFVVLALVIAACTPTPTATPIPSATPLPPTTAPATAAATTAATTAATGAATVAATSAATPAATLGVTTAATTAATSAPSSATVAATTAATGAASGSATAIKIAVVTDVGRVDDRSFNQSAWEGAQAAAKDLGGTAKYLVPNGPEDYATDIQSFADQGYNVIVTVGFALGDATDKAAVKYPKIKFIGVDQF